MPENIKKKSKNVLRDIAVDMKFWLLKIKDRLKLKNEIHSFFHYSKYLLYLHIKNAKEAQKIYKLSLHNDW